MKELSEEGNTEEALRIGEALLRPDSFASWRRDLELEGSRVIEPALELAGPALSLFGLTGDDPGRRAAVHYARGVVQLLEEDRDAARTEFGSSTTLAGGGELRLDASYNLGTTVLLQGEEAFANIPEVAGLSGAPPMQPSVPHGAQLPGTPPGGPAAEEEDPLEKARALYLEAKDLLVERLRLDWRDEDTRANVELAMRRLRQLDEIEQQREEQQQEQEQQEQEQSDDSDQQKQGDQANQENDPQEGEQEQPEEQEPPDPSEEPSEEESQQKGQPEERTLTEEEVQRLLNMLQEYEEQGKEALEQRRQGRRRRTERDW